MNVQEAYNQWAKQYDTNENQTRDLEGVAIRKFLAKVDWVNCLEIGCGTGKNTEWLALKSNHILAIDLSEEMLEIAKTKIQTKKVEFIQADINKEWTWCRDNQFDLVTFSLVLEHIENLDNIFSKLKAVVKNGGFVYVGELHPFKQYKGTKARFEAENGLQIVTCFNHNISDFTNSAKNFGFEIIDFDEFFDNDDRTKEPRILTLFFKKVS